MWPEESRWRESVPDLLDRVRRRWRLTVTGELTGGSASVVHTVRTVGGTEAVLKLSLPHREARDEAAALRRWDGRGAVRLLDHDADDFALLLERCEPGTRLVDSGLPPLDQLSVLSDALVRIWSTGDPGSGFESLAEVAAEWADLVEQRMARLHPPYDPDLVAHGVHLLRTLPTGADPVLLHGDANPGNLLAARRDPWLVIDPKPMVGDPAFDPAPALLQVGALPDADRTGVLLERIEHVADRSDLDPRRIADWTLARLVEWALWYADRGELEAGASELRIAADLRRD